MIKLIIFPKYQTADNNSGWSKIDYQEKTQWDQLMKTLPTLIGGKKEKLKDWELTLDIALRPSKLDVKVLQL